MTSNYNFVLNFNNSAPINTGYTFKTGDKGITFNFDVRELDPTGMTPKIAFHRANATSVESSIVTLADGIYSYTILGNEFAVPGVVIADLKFYNSDTQRVSSASFIFGVISDTLDGLGGGTAGYSDELETLRAEMEEAEATLEAYVAAFGDLGPLNPRGDYDANEDYTTCDCVYYNGASWLCKAPCSGETPGYPSDYWQKIADGGDTSNLAHKVTGATAGNFAGLDANGDLTDSGIATQFVKDATNILGAKNLLVFPYANKGYASNGITITVSDNGSVTVSGTYSGNSDMFFDLQPAETYSPLHLRKDGTSYRFTSGTEDETEKCFAYAQWRYGSAGSYSWSTQQFDGDSFTPSGGIDLDYYPAGAYICVKVGAVISTPITFKPMLTLASDPDADTYAPYAQTNHELTIGKAPVDSIAPTEDGATASQAYAIGKHFYRGGNLCVAIADITSGGTFTLGTNYKVTSVGTELDWGYQYFGDSYDSWGSNYITPVSGTWNNWQRIGNIVIATAYFSCDQTYTGNVPIIGGMPKPKYSHAMGCAIGINCPALNFAVDPINCILYCHYPTQGNTYLGQVIYVCE